MTGKNTQDPLRNRPLQIMHSFEGLANGLDGVEVMPTFGRPRPFSTANFEERVRAELRRLAARGIGGLVVNVGYDGYLENEEGWRRFVRGVEMAVELGLRIWIYDEDGYPGGSAGGLSIKGHPELEALGIKRMRMGETVAPRRLALPSPRARVFAVFGADKDGRRHRLDIEKDGMEVSLQSGEFESLDIYFTAPNFEGTHAATLRLRANRTSTSWTGAPSTVSSPSRTWSTSGGFLRISGGACRRSSRTSRRSCRTS